MENFYKVLLIPTKKNLHKHFIEYFDPIFSLYPEHAEKIISFINECYNYKSEFLVEEKNWATLLSERFKANAIPLSYFDAIINNETPEIVKAIEDFLNHQKQHVFSTKVAKENLRMILLATIQNNIASLGDRKTANEMITELDKELESINEKLRQDQKVFGNYKGYDAIKKARSVTQLSITNVD